MLFTLTRLASNNHTSWGSLFVPFVCGKCPRISLKVRGPTVTRDSVGDETITGATSDVVVNNTSR